MKDLFFPVGMTLAGELERMKVKQTQMARSKGSFQQ